jgi:hypothetical protein
MVRLIARPLAIGVPVAKVCNKLKQAHPEVCQVSYPHSVKATAVAGDGSGGSGGSSGGSDSTSATDEAAAFDELLGTVSVSSTSQSGKTDDDDYEF